MSSNTDEKGKEDKMAARASEATAGAPSDNEPQSQPAESIEATPSAEPSRQVTQGTVRAATRPALGYFASIKRAAWSILEGMAVTFSYLRRPPITVQYPDRTPEPVSETLPERFRGLLEVDVLTCTGCQACERACPIGVIRIELGKEGKLRYLTRFDIDLGKCMYCGFCVEACPVDAQAPGDREVTHAIRFSREFEGVQAEFSALTYRYIHPGDQVPVAKAKKGQALPTVRRGDRAREARLLASSLNPPLIERARARLARDPLARQAPPPAEAALQLKPVAEKKPTGKEKKEP